MKNFKENFCYLPFTQMLLQPTGNITPCCWNQKYILGNNQEAPILDLWNGPKMQALRREFLSGNPTSCREQMTFIQCHKFSDRPSLKDIDLRPEMLQGPKRLDLRLNGKCNLQCVMCDVWKQPNGIFDQTDFWSTATEKIFPYLKEIDVLGGEPFVQKDSFRLIREISRINPDCTWAFVTNGNYNFIPVAKHLDQVHLRWIQLSLDASTEKTYLEVRKGGGFQLVLRTLQLLTEYREVRERMDAPFDLSVSFCVQRGNWLEIPGFLELCQKFNVHPIFQLLFEPTPLSLLTLPEIEKKKIATFLEPLRNEGLQSAILNPLLHSLTEERKQSPRDLNFPS